jgi:murein L,D-transpeptidase YafK
MVDFSRILRVVALAAAGLVAIGLASCSDMGGGLPKHLRPLDQKMRDLIERKGMDEKSPIFIRLFKEESVLEVWKPTKATGRYALLQTYEICAWSGVLGPKIKEGDRQAPEGFYTIRPAQMNPDSSYYLAFNMGYPNDFDRSHGRTGSELMVHGACSSRGCYSMTDENIQEIYTLGRLSFEGGQRDFQVQAFPFRMTPENLARHSDDPNMPFWIMLKEGYDHFDTIGQPPKVDVCDRRYVFNSVPAEGRSFAANAACPPMSMPERIRIAVNEKAAKDNERMLEIAGRLDRREGGDSVSALRLALAMPTSAEQAAPMSIAAVPPPLDSAATNAPRPEQAPIEILENSPTIAATAPVVEEPAPLPSPRPAPAEVAAAPVQAEPAPAAAPVPTPIEPASAPAPDVQIEAVEAPPPAQEEDVSPSDAATLEERMLVESTPSTANAYASPEDSSLTEYMLRLIPQ